MTTWFICCGPLCLHGEVILSGSAGIGNPCWCIDLAVKFISMEQALCENRRHVDFLNVFFEWTVILVIRQIPPEYTWNIQKGKTNEV